MKSRVNWKPCEKCKWQDEACYLVYMLAKGTIKPQINRLEAIHKYSHSPSYYGRFIHNIGSLGTPLPLWNGASLNKKGNGDLLVLLVGPFRLVPDDVNFLGWHKKRNLWVNIWFLALHDFKCTLVHRLGNQKIEALFAFLFQEYADPWPGTEGKLCEESAWN